jgi:NAD(P)-dependent dehydrogenase (short-subunit alcohol dehydrogenase family)
MIDMTGKKALITGGSRGIGRATAILFAQAGADVAISFQRQEKAALEVKAKVEALGRSCLAFQVDISREAEVSRMVEDIIRTWGRTTRESGRTSKWGPGPRRHGKRRWRSTSTAFSISLTPSCSI